MKILKVSLSILLAMLMLVSALSVPAFAADTAKASVSGKIVGPIASGTTGECEWEVYAAEGDEPCTLYIKGRGKTADYKQSSATETAPPWKGFDIVNVVVEEGVTYLGDNSFRGMDSTISVSLPESLTKIGSRAFYQCRNLNDITLPKNLAELGDSVFAETTEVNSGVPWSIILLGRFLFWVQDAEIVFLAL